ncbi:MAG: SMP-30/gluconolactonase/LRE family protein [Myxococcaceae bacterium]|nr:SMP-30/gluconolactonase/LRE family protein [Myxococcaceae bacterium]
MALSPRKALALSAGFLALGVLAGLGFLLADAGVFRALTPHGFEQCTRVEVAGSEDLVFDAATGLVLISSTDFRALEEGSDAAGAILSWNPAAPATPSPVPHDFKGALHPHGLALWPLDGGGRRLFVVNHPTRASSTVELFDVLDGPGLRHLRTIEAPEFISMNDLAPVGPEAFYVTLDAGTRAGTAGRFAETLLGLPWAGVGHFDGTRATVVARDLRYSNGIAVSADGATVFVSESTGHRLLAYGRDVATGALTLRAQHREPAGLDNLSFDATGALWVGAHPKLLDFLGHARDPSKPSPSQVLRVTFDTTQGRFNVKDIGVDDGARLSGASVALPLGGGRVLVGSVFSHVLDCRFTD